MRNIFLLLIISISFFSCEKETENLELEKKTEIRLKKITTYSSHDKSELHGMTTFDYDENGNRIKESYYFKDSIQPLIYSVFEYENDKKAHELKYNITGDTYKLSQKYSFYYVNNLLIKKELRYPPDETVSNYNEFEYDENQNLITEFNIQVEPFFKWKTEHIFDFSSKRIKTIRYNEISDISGYTDYHYEESLLTNEKIYNSNGEMITEYHYKYNSKNLITEKNQTREDVTKPIQINEYSDTLLIKRTIYDWSYNRGYNYRFLGISYYEYE